MARRRRRNLKLARVGTRKAFGKAHSTTVSVSVRRQQHATKRSAAFEVCAMFGKHMACEKAASPSKGSAKALRKLAGQLSKRPAAHLNGLFGL